MTFTAALEILLAGGKIRRVLWHPSWKFGPHFHEDDDVVIHYEDVIADDWIEVK